VRVPSVVRVALSAAAASAIAALVSLACGESRHPIGEECVRDDDCLSAVCAARMCVSAPTLVNGAGRPPPDEQPRIPDATATPGDAKAEGG
jgi:hypothetical protein